MVSVIIPAYNEEKLIGTCLDSLVEQTDANFEVVLVDNNSTDQTSAIAQQYAKKLNLTIVLEKRKGRGKARATGFLKARGQYLLSTDADTTVPPTWVETITRQLDSKNMLPYRGRL
ncbi:MAG: hypothetical protein A2782_00975 [Candidatus Blackburnbacteria bacterium RIFCSPHIGHO2_01_FULL_43_15b]|uniref:Glycosyltransferase 2-like domain-containing protein n=1 Tax=Candidatus Blackburnbacteria bacterium RIFCSPHIGHO2_01_FULL_43_15b TaxID=1797513 RepID=A0A1G1V129_9BACT|nr:MAG: hypothetical protein A2782_00975 [Candidatus Blackburnbacteria bacterium RIFCSPHIGHO2_01_FULL_43_15b]